VYVRVGIGRKTDVDAGIRDGRKGSTERQTDRQTDRQTVLCAVPGDDDEAGEGKESEE